MFGFNKKQIYFKKIKEFLSCSNLNKEKGPDGLFYFNISIGSLHLYGREDSEKNLNYLLITDTTVFYDYFEYEEDSGIIICRTHPDIGKL
jgi:hypothetical protein